MLEKDKQELNNIISFFLQNMSELLKEVSWMHKTRHDEELRHGAVDLTYNGFKATVDIIGISRVYLTNDQKEFGISVLLFKDKESQLIGEFVWKCTDVDSPRVYSKVIALIESYVDAIHNEQIQFEHCSTYVNRYLFSEDKYKISKPSLKSFFNDRLVTQLPILASRMDYNVRVKMKKELLSFGIDFDEQDIDTFNEVTVNVLDYLCGYQTTDERSMVLFIAGDERYWLFLRNNQNTYRLIYSFKRPEGIDETEMDVNIMAELFTKVRHVLARYGTALWKHREQQLRSYAIHKLNYLARNDKESDLYFAIDTHGEEKEIWIGQLSKGSIHDFSLDCGITFNVRMSNYIILQYRSLGKRECFTTYNELYDYVKGLVIKPE